MCFFNFFGLPFFFNNALFNDSFLETEGTNTRVGHDDVTLRTTLSFLQRDRKLANFTG